MGTEFYHALQVNLLESDWLAEGLVALNDRNRVSVEDEFLGVRVVPVAVG